MPALVLFTAQEKLFERRDYLVKILACAAAALAYLICTGCAPQPGQPDLPSMAREMTGEFGTFTVDVKDEVVDRVLDETGGLTGYDEREAHRAAARSGGQMLP